MKYSIIAVHYVPFLQHPMFCYLNCKLITRQFFPPTFQGHLKYYNISMVTKTNLGKTQKKIDGRKPTPFPLQNAFHFECNVNTCFPRTLFAKAHIIPYT